MVINDILNVKLHCLRIYYYIQESAKSAQNEVTAINCGEIDHDSILNVCNKTVEFANKIIHELENYTNSIKDDIANLEGEPATENENVQVKKECSTKKSIFSLRKDEKEELTQDEFLEIYKIDMTENLNSPSQKPRVFKNTATENDSTSSDSNSRDDEENNSKSSSRKQMASKNMPSKDNSTNSDSSLAEVEKNKRVETDKNSKDDCNRKSGSSPSQNKRKDLENLNETDSNSKDDCSRKSDSSPSQNKRKDSDNLNEIDILRKIGCDTSEFESDSNSLFSCSTVLLDDDISESNAEEDVECDRNIVENAEKSNDSIHENAQSDLDSKQCYRKEKDDKFSDDIDDKEMREIENLINLDTLKRKRNSSELIKPRKKKRKVKNENEDDSHGSSSEKSYDSSSKASEHINDKEQEKELILTQDHKSQDGNEVMNFLLNCISDVSDLIADTDSDDGSSTDVEKNKNKKLIDKELKKNDKQNGNKIDNENVETNEDIKKKKKWRRAKLLTERFTDVSSDDDKENDPKQKRQKKKLKSRTSIIIKSDNSTQTESDRSSDSESEYTANSSSGSSSSDDLEFITSSKPNLAVKEETEIDKDAEDNVKTGRRNIRTVQSDASLATITKKALREEEERRDRLQKRVQLVSDQSEVEGLVLDIDKITKEPLIVVDKYITRRLKEHQREGVRFMWNSCYESVERLKTSTGTGCILAHCMGLGKTLQVIALIDTLFAHQETNTNHVLIVCPLSTVLNWENEFQKTYSEIEKGDDRIKRYLIRNGKSKNERYRTVKRWYRNKGVLIVGYDSFQSLLKVSPTFDTIPEIITEALLDPGPDLVICDEGHLIKNGNKSRAKTLMKVKTKRRIILTGTPMQNNLTEYYHMVNFVKPQLLGTKSEFNNRFVNPIVNGGYHDSTDIDIKVMRKRCHVLHEYLKGTIQRYEMSELEMYLPDKLDYVLFVKMHPLQVELYKAYLDTIDLTKRRSNSFFPDFLRLRDVSTHPCILRLKERNKPLQQNKKKEIDTFIIEPEINKEIPGEWWQSRCPDDVLSNIEYGPKIKIMLEIIEQSVRLNDKVLVFLSNLIGLDAIEFFLQKNGWTKNFSYLRMDGTVSPDMRKVYCDKFNDTKPDNPIKLFLLSHKVGGIGLNLVAANRIILMDVSFNPAVDSQSIFRTYRFGQNKRCHVYRLISLGTMEEVMYERSITKLAISLKVVDEHQTSRHYTSHDLKKMLKFKTYNDDQRPILKLPADEVLASILEKCKMEIFKYHEHKDLLENRPEEQLNEEEQKLAWEEFRREQTEESNEEQKRGQQQAANLPLTIQSIPFPNRPSTSNAAAMIPNSIQPIRPTMVSGGQISQRPVFHIRGRLANDIRNPNPVSVRQRIFNTVPNTTASNIAQSVVSASNSRQSNTNLATRHLLLLNRSVTIVPNRVRPVLQAVQSRNAVKIPNIRPKLQPIQKTVIPIQRKRIDGLDGSSESVTIIDLEADSPVNNSKASSEKNKNDKNSENVIRAGSTGTVTVIDLDETDSSVNHSQGSPARGNDNSDNVHAVAGLSSKSLTVIDLVETDSATKSNKKSYSARHNTEADIVILD